MAKSSVSTPLKKDAKIDFIFCPESPIHSNRKRSEATLPDANGHAIDGVRAACLKLWCVCVALFY